MQIKKEQSTPTSVKLSISAEPKELSDLKNKVVLRLGVNAKVAGFRSGKAPAHLIEKQLDSSALQTEFLDEAINQLFMAAIQHEKLRAVAQPSIAITKFVPFSTLEFKADISVIGEVKLADYKNLKLKPKKPEVTTKDVQDVIDTLLSRSASRTQVKRAAKSGDELLIDFVGKDAKTEKPIDGGSADAQTLVLGSNSFIPGFEEGLVGVSTGETKVLSLTFPKDYATKDLQSKKVNFTVKVGEVRELVKPKFDDTFVSTIGPFKTVAEAKSNIKQDILQERSRDSQAAFDNEILATLAEKSTIVVPDSLVDEEITRMEEDEKRNLTYRGQTWQEHLSSEGLTEQEHHEKQRPVALQRVKAGLVLAEIAEKEKIAVNPEELEVRIMLLKNQYSNDDSMVAELDKPENRRDINNRLMTEKTLDRLRSYVTSK